jgi:hypothetical protein
MRLRKPVVRSLRCPVCKSLVTVTAGQRTCGAAECVGRLAANESGTKLTAGLQSALGHLTINMREGHDGRDRE